MKVTHCAKCGEPLSKEDQDRGIEICSQCEDEYNEIP